MDQGDTIRARERLGGILLLAAAGLALVAANSPLSAPYQALFQARLGAMSLEHWISDGLMAIFFLLVGLEVKREWLVGRLADKSQRRLPLIAAGAGMAVPALVFLLVTGFDPLLARGWAIPAATDIAFALGVLALLGARAPPQLKLLLVTIAIIDDIGAVAIIALFYTDRLDLEAVAAAVIIASSMAALARLGERRLWPFVASAAGLWLAVLASGVHPTIAGVIAALTIPLRGSDAPSPLHRLEHRLHPWVMFAVVPLFGFANAGASIGGPLVELASPLPLAIAGGLFVGKQLGIFGGIAFAVRSGLALRPPGVSWLQLYGMTLLCGIGFTMSLFITALAFPGDQQAVADARLGTLAGSLMAGLAGTLVLRLARPRPGSAQEQAEAERIFAGTGG